MANLVLLGIVFVAGLFIASSFLGMQLISLTAILFSVGVILVLNGFKVKAIGKLPVSSTASLALGGLMVVFSLGLLAPILGGLNLNGQTASVTSPVTGVQLATVTSDTAAAPCSVPAELLGKASTVTVNAWNQESNTPFSAAVDANARIYVNGNYRTVLTDTSANTFTAAVGDVVKVYGGNATFYTDSSEFCVQSEAPTLEINAHAVATSANMAITGYDSTASVELSAGTTSGEEDYDIVLGANQEESIYLRQKVNAADVSFQLGGIAVFTQNDIDSLELKETGWTKSVVPKFLKNSHISNGTTAGTTTVNITTGYEDLYKPAQPVLFHEFDEAKYKFTIKAGATDPSTVNSWTTSDVAIVCFVDATWSRGDDGKESLDVFQHDTDEANVGQVEDILLPLGQDNCVVIEGL